MHHRKCNIVQYTTCLAWKERRRGYRGAGLEGSFYLQSHSPMKGLTLHQRRKQTKKNSNFFFPGRRLTSTAKHHKHGGFTSAIGTQRNITTSQSEISPVNSETLKRQHMADTRHYSVHGPMETSLLTQREDFF